ncbi:MAG: YegP family protein [Candidatus Bathyarchaeota archaeon]
MTAKYQVYKDMAGKYRFRLRAANNKIVAVSEAYESKAACMNGVKSVQNNCSSHVEDQTKDMEKLTNPKYEIFTDVSNEFRFHLKASNGEIIAASEGYETKEGVLNGIDAVQRSCDAEIEDLTVTKATVPKAGAKGDEYAGIEEVCKEPAMGVNDTVLLLNSLPQQVDSGTTVSFTGKLTAHDTMEGIGCAEIYIMERDRSFLRDDLLASGATNNDGTYSINWEATQRDFWDNKIQVYASFKGTENYKPAKSDLHHMKVIWYAKRK